MPIAQFEGKALVFNNGVVDVVQGDTSLVDSEKVAHIPVANVAIDNETIIMNANHELEVPIDEDTIYIDGAGFMKAKQGGSGATYSAGEHISISSENVISAEWPEVSDHKVILCTKVGNGAAGPVGSFTLNQNSDKTITIPIPEPEVKEYTGGTDIEVTSEGVINYTGSNTPDIDDFTIRTNSEGKIETGLGGMYYTINTPEYDVALDDTNAWGAGTPASPGTYWTLYKYDMDSEANAEVYNHLLDKWVGYREDDDYADRTSGKSVRLIINFTDANGDAQTFDSVIQDLSVYFENTSNSKLICCSFVWPIPYTWNIPGRACINFDEAHMLSEVWQTGCVVMTQEPSVLPQSIQSVQFKFLENDLTIRKHINNTWTIPVADPVINDRAIGLKYDSSTLEINGLDSSKLRVKQFGSDLVPLDSSKTYSLEAVNKVPTWVEKSSSTTVEPDNKTIAFDSNHKLKAVVGGGVSVNSASLDLSKATSFVATVKDFATQNQKQMNALFIPDNYIGKAISDCRVGKSSLSMNIYTNGEINTVNFERWYPDEYQSVYDDYGDNIFGGSADDAYSWIGAHSMTKPSWTDIYFRAFYIKYFRQDWFPYGKDGILILIDDSESIAQGDTYTITNVNRGTIYNQISNNYIPANGENITIPNPPVINGNYVLICNVWDNAYGGKRILYFWQRQS